MGTMVKRIVLINLLLLILTTACTSERATVRLPTATSIPTESHATSIPTEASPTPSKEPKAVHLRIEFQTTSDWSDLTFLSPENLIETKLLSVEGDPIDYEITSERVSISQPAENAEAGDQVGITFDLLLDPVVLNNPQFLLLERGDLNASNLKIYYVSNDQQILLQEINHERMVLDQLGRNPNTIVLDLSVVQD
jgi:hypothetical protein